MFQDILRTFPDFFQLSLIFLVSSCLTNLRDLRGLFHLRTQHFTIHEDLAVPSNMIQGVQVFPDFPWKQDLRPWRMKTQPQTFRKIMSMWYMI